MGVIESYAISRKEKLTSQISTAKGFMKEKSRVGWLVGICSLYFYSFFICVLKLVNAKVGGAETAGRTLLLFFLFDSNTQLSYFEKVVSTTTFIDKKQEKKRTDPGRMSSSSDALTLKRIEMPRFIKGLVKSMTISRA